MKYASIVLFLKHKSYFFSGFAAEFCHVDKTIQMTLCSEPHLLDGVTGLLGTANNNQTDDIQTPSGTLPTNQSDPSLYQILSECE